MRLERFASPFLSVLLFSVFCSPSLSSAKIEIILGKIPLKENSNLISLPNAKSQEVIISRKQYVLSYNKERRSLNWAAWRVDRRNLGSSERSKKFFRDEELQNYLSQIPNIPPVVAPADYKGSCFDRGHQVPSGDRTDTPENNASTFVMSNMLPQTPYLNRYLWEQLERYTRVLVREGKKVHVIAGPIYDDDFGAIGPNGDIPVPSKLFKIIVIQERNGEKSHISVVMPNTLSDGQSPTNREALCNESASPADTITDEWEQYRTSIPEIEKAAGLSFERIQ